MTLMLKYTVTLIKYWCHILYDWERGCAFLKSEVFSILMKFNSVLINLANLFLCKTNLKESRFPPGETWGRSVAITKNDIRKGGGAEELGWGQS